MLAILFCFNYCIVCYNLFCFWSKYWKDKAGSWTVDILALSLQENSSPVFQKKVKLNDDQFTAYLQVFPSNIYGKMVECKPASYCLSNVTYTYFCSVFFFHTMWNCWASACTIQIRASLVNCSFTVCHFLTRNLESPCKYAPVNTFIFCSYFSSASWLQTIRQMEVEFSCIHHITTRESGEFEYQQCKFGHPHW
jgi:hypothetical protein